MKINVTGLDIPLGKTKYLDRRFQQLVERFAPNKVTPFVAEFQTDNMIGADAVAVTPEKLLDILIPDMEKCETRLRNATQPAERDLVQRCLQEMEKETPLCDVAFSGPEQEILKVLAPISAKPVVIAADGLDPSELIGAVLQKAHIIFFYTAGKKEVRAWPVKSGSDIVTCAAKIHSDLARGFIKGDVVGFSDFMSVFNMQEAKSRGLVKLVDRDYVVQDGDIIEIRFSV